MKRSSSWGFVNQRIWVLRYSAVLLVLFPPVPVLGKSETILAKPNCAFRSGEKISDAFLSQFKKEKIDVDLETAEGTTITVFRDQWREVAVLAMMYGETGRIRLTIVTGNLKPVQYDVHVKEERYRAPISQKSTVIASTSEHYFRVCGEDTDNYPGGADMQTWHDLAEEILRKTLEAVQRRRGR